MSYDHRATIQHLTDAINGGSFETFISFLANDAKWMIVGEHTLSGREPIRDFMAQSEGHAPPNISIDSMIIDGDQAAAYGEMSMTENGETTEFMYCDLYRFNGSEISELISFITKKQKGEYKCHP